MAKLLALEALEAEGAVSGHVALLKALEAALGLLARVLLGLRAVTRVVSFDSAVVAASSSRRVAVAVAASAVATSVASTTVAASTSVAVASSTVAVASSAVATAVAAAVTSAALERFVSVFTALEALHY